MNQPKGHFVGYARVSSAGQNLQTQEQLLRDAGCDKIFTEKMTGKDMDIRDELKLCIDYVREGDTLIATRGDRIARNFTHMSEIVKKLDEKGVALRTLDHGFDTSTKNGKAMMGMLSIFAEMEAGWIAERAAQGRARAKAAGVRFGRKPKITREQQKKIYAASLKDGANISEIARRFKISRPTVYRAINDEKQLLGYLPGQNSLFEDE